MKKTSTAGAITTLYYVHDPMCSWCWGFRPVWQQLLAKLSSHVPDNMQIRYILGGLAGDTDELMPQKMQYTISTIWQQIQTSIPGTEFNYAFWEKCKPRRSTYPACRAVIAAKQQGAEYEEAMILAIQQAYYLQAKNPSDQSVLVDIAEGIGLRRNLFERDLVSNEVNQELLANIRLSRQLGAQGFPSLILDSAGERNLIVIDYNQMDVMLGAILKQVVNKGRAAY